MAGSVDIVFYEDTFTFRLDHLGLFAGLMSKDDLVCKVDHMIPYTGPHMHLTSGELLQIMILRMASNYQPGGLNSIQQWAATVPAVLLGADPGEKHNKVAAVNRFAIARLLDRVADYGPDSFLTEFMAAVTPAHEVQTGHMDISFIKSSMMPQDDNSPEIVDPELLQSMHEEEKDLTGSFLKGNHTELPQAGILGLSARTSACGHPVLISAAPVSGNEKDISRYQSFAMNGALEAIKRCCPNLNLLVMESAGASPETLNVCSKLGINVITILPDSRIKPELEQVADGSLAFDEFTVKDNNDPDAPELTVRYAWLADQETGVSGDGTAALKRIMFIAQDRRTAREKAVKARADKELKEVSAKLEKLCTTPYSCMDDAVRAVEEIKRKLRLCTISVPEFEDIPDGNNKGRPEKGKARSVIGVKAKAEASIDREAVSRAVEKELCYVVATTDTTMKTTCESAICLYQTYHEQSDIEGGFKSIKAAGTFFDSIFLASEKRMQALAAVMAIAHFYTQRVLELIAEVCIENGRKVSPGKAPDCQRPSWKQLLKFSESHSPELLLTSERMFYPPIFKGSIFYLAAKQLGAQALDYYDGQALGSRHEYIYRTALEWRRISQNETLVRA